MRNKIKPPGVRERRIIKVMVLIGLFSILNFLLFFFEPSHRGNIFLFSLLSITLLYGAVKKLYMWYNYSNISVPDSPGEGTELKVDVLTTYFPGEPYQMIVTTLEAILKISYPHTTYLCDEANDPFLKNFCEEHGIVHVTRDNRKNAKAGNINNALRTKATGDICVILDPDHIPEPDFLDPILPHFNDPEIGFVQIVQSYYNIKDSLVARGAAEQTFQFYGPMMMTLNAYGTVNAIGANCVFRRTALDSIGGHAPGLCEDMHTTMLLYSKGWKAVYLPEVLAKGLAPSSLTTYFKQQLKWTRGTFDLLFKVYPKVFRNLSLRQKIHFGILPLHYLCGLIYLINFLIPILALLFSTTPWRGNIVEFILAVLPVAASGILIRTFVQKWVIEKEERGFHVVGGLLQINTWWIYLLGFVYTLVDKKVPYLPTPKQSEFNTNLKIVIPNAGVAILSVFAIIYGLRQDFTPFSVIMAGFAFFNTLIMLFGIYLSARVTNQNKILSSNLKIQTIKHLWKIKTNMRKSFHAAFSVTRKAALPLLVVVLGFSLGFKDETSDERWENVSALYHSKASDNYLGIYHPVRDEGLIDIEEINALEARKNINFDIISFYLAWSEESVDDFPTTLMNSVNDKNAIPMITWEPWISTLTEDGSSTETFRRIAEGEFDDYIKAFTAKLVTYDRPVFLRFAHEFDNPQYPWHISEENPAEDFKAAWQHVYKLMKKQGANEVIFVWNPWKASNMLKSYPGDKYVDWIGVTLLNYGSLAKVGEEYSLSTLYEPFHIRLNSFTRKPVMLSEFSSVNFAGQQQEWLKDAMNSIVTNYKEINAVVLFNSAFDNNIPKNSWYDKEYIDWSIDSIQAIAEIFDHSPKSQISSIAPISYKSSKDLVEQQIKGVHYKKGADWRDNYYVLTKETVVEDFEKITKAGFNTIQFKGGNVYEYNVLKYADNFNLQVIYQFNLEPASGFTNQEKLRELEEDIIEKIEDLQKDSAVEAFSFSLDLQTYYEKPLLFYQRNALIEWLQPLFIEIKNIAPHKAIFVELPFNAESENLVKNMKQVLPIDSYGFYLSGGENPEELNELSKKLQVNTHISSVKPELYLKNYNKIEGLEVLLESWQDERLSYRIAFNGLVDYKGRPKKVLEEIQDVYNDKNLNPIPGPALRILKPAVPLLEGQTLTYTAMVYNNNKWIDFSDYEVIPEMEWSLVKNDKFGNHLALKFLGEGPNISVRIPKDYKNYDLLLSLKDPDSNHVLQVISQLHTPSN